MISTLHSQTGGLLKGTIMVVLSVIKLSINNNNDDGLKFFVILRRRMSVTDADGSYLSVGPVNDTYNNTSYQCILTINDNIIESDTAGTITVIGMYARHCN